MIPKRQLVIGHSLGDGFYFNFKDWKKVSDKEIELLSSKMKQLVCESQEIERVTLSIQDAVKVFSKQGYNDAVSLIKSMNRPSVDMYRIGDYYNIAYEPIAPNTKMLGVWELRKYGDHGMLLRYPVKSKVEAVGSFKDNNKLFDVFEENRIWARMLEVECVGHMNAKSANGSIEQYVRLSESLQRRKIAGIADEIHRRGSKAVFIAGPSSSGKTTFAKRMCEQLLLLGHFPIRISLDDYYKPPEEAPKDEDGKPDLETIDALNIKLFEKNMDDLFSGKEVDLPHFSFKKKKTFYLRGGRSSSIDSYKFTRSRCRMLR